MSNFSIKKLSSTAVTLFCLATLPQVTYGMDQKHENVSLKIQTIQKLGKEQFIQFIDKPPFLIKDQHINVRVNVLRKALSFTNEDNFELLINTLNNFDELGMNPCILQDGFRTWETGRFAKLWSAVEKKVILQKDSLEKNNLQKVLRAAWGQKREIFNYTPQASLNDFLLKMVPFASVLECASVKPGALSGIMAVLKDKPQVKALFLKGAINDEEIKSCLKELEMNKNITGIRLTSSKLGDEGVKAIGNYLKDDKTITRFDILEKKISNGAAKVLFEGLKTSKINTMFLHENELGVEGAKLIGDYLSCNPLLSRFMLEGNDLGNEGVKFLFEGLEKNTNLKILSLRWDSVDDTGAKTIGEFLKTNKIMTELHLELTKITSKGALFIAECLKGNKTFAKLLLSSSLDQNTQESIAKMLPDIIVEFAGY